MSAPRSGLGGSDSPGPTGAEREPRPPRPTRPMAAPALTDASGAVNERSPTTSTGPTGTHTPRRSLLQILRQSEADAMPAPASPLGGVGEPEQVATRNPPRLFTQPSRAGATGTAGTFGVTDPTRAALPPEQVESSSPHLVTPPRQADAAAATSHQRSEDQLLRLPPTHLHAVYAKAQVGSLPNQATGADWQYTGSVQTADGYRHSFQHPSHPLTSRPEVRWVESTAADVAPARKAKTGPLS